MKKITSKRLENLPNFEIGEPFFIRNLLLFPFHDGDGEADGILTAEEAKRAGILSIEETQRIDTVILSYEGNTPLYMLDGEEIIGAYQNRVLNTSVYVEEPIRTEVPVSCVEEGRWSGDKSFRPTYLSAYPTLRAIIASSVTDSLRKKKRFKSDQNLIWESIEERFSTFKVKSVTSSMHDIYESLNKEISTYLREFEEGISRQKKISKEIEENDNLENSMGFLAFSGDRYLGMELFSSKRFFQKFKKKLITGYTLDALSLTSKTTPILETEAAKKWVNSIINRKYTSFPGVVKGTEYRYKGKKKVARALYKEEKLLHLSAFSLPFL